jgi:asparagine synthase (glutamine-hydrolysing)
VERRVDVVALNRVPLVRVRADAADDLSRNPEAASRAHPHLFGERIEISSYWDLSLKKSESRPPVSWRDYQERLRYELEQAVQREMVSDVPIGVSERRPRFDDGPGDDDQDVDAAR